ncbi:MAG: hypothetical protein IKF91_04960 [Bacilli bacterium]|nr:hypothetical protein [Bacilli bacterium]
MIKINEILKNHNLKAKRIKKIGKATIIDTNTESFVIKNSHINEKILMYLKSRNFDYMPDIIENKDYNITKYIKEFNIPKEQKMDDLIKLLALLHSKTTHYKDINVEKVERIYNQLNDNINYLYSYYTDLITVIESKVFMSPSDLLFASNITNLYELLEYNKQKLEKWYNIVKNKNKERNTIIHNNLKLNHFIRNNKSYLISWDKSKIDSPVFDLYKLYKNEKDFNYISLLKTYEKSYPLQEDEKILLELLISIPEDIKLPKKEYEKCIEINKILEKINFLPKTSEQREEKKNK